MVDKEAILKENKLRNDQLAVYYNPITGEGSPIERFKLFLDDKSHVLLPLSMKDIPLIEGITKEGNIKKFLTSTVGEYTEAQFIEFINGLSNLRFDHDFEYWAATSVHIKHKITGNDVLFVLNRGQRILLSSLERMRQEGIPIRIVLLKARQWGGSTLTQIYSAWIQVVLKKDSKWNSVIVADVENQTLNIRTMFNNLAKLYPKSTGKITLKRFEGSSKNKQIEENDTVISIGSMQKPESLRSDDVKIMHGSEIGSWKATPSRTPEDLSQAIKSSIPKLPLTMIVEESTAKGVGNYFHRQWQRAISGESGYDPVFVSWFDIERNRKKIENFNKFIDRMNEYDWFLWGLGATLEGICWYNDFLNSELMGDHWRMKSENPSTPEEAFQSTGRRAFSPLYVLQARITCKEPLYKGELFADSVKGKGALKNIRFDNYDGGNLWIWDLPDKSINVKNRYCAFEDIGGRNKDADWSIISVFDRYWMMDGGMPERVATWRGHLDQDLVAWKAAQIAKWYNNALLAVETNSLKTQQSEGDHFLTILDEIKDYYDNLYARIDPEKINQGIPIKYGFHTNMSTKPMIIDMLNAALRDTLYVERDSRACDEMDYFEIKENGTYGAVEGQHDDIVVTTAGGVWLAIKHMDAPVLMDEKVIRKRKKIISEATM
jgi:hypothetical protein